MQPALSGRQPQGGQLLLAQACPAIADGLAQAAFGLQGLAAAGGLALAGRAPDLPGLERLAQAPQPIDAVVAAVQRAPAGGGRRLLGFVADQPQPGRGPPAVVPARVLPQQLAPMRLGLLGVSQLRRAQAQPKAPAGIQGQWQRARETGATRGQQLLCRLPAAGQDLAASPLPLQLPAGWIGGPALHDRQRRGVPRRPQGRSGPHGRVVAPGAR